MKTNEFLTTMQLSHLLATDVGINGDEATVIDAIYCSRTPITLDNLKEIINKTFHIEIEQERINNTVKRLINENKLYYSDDILNISYKTIEDICSVITTNEQIEDIATKEWLVSYQKTITSELPFDIANSIKLCILNFIRTLFLSHGADCYKLITGNKHNITSDIKSIASESAKQIVPKYLDSVSHFLEEIFSNNLTDSQMKFLLTQLKKAINYLSMVVDNQTQSALISQLNQVTIYLDTTILYRLLNLQGEKRYNSIKSLINFCQKANISLKVFQTSVEEMKRRIEYDAHVIITYPTPVSFASIGYKCRTSENYISTFWKMQSECGVSAKDFNFRYSNILALLQEYKIEVDERNYIKEFNLDQKMIDLCSKVLHYSNSDPEYQKSANSMSHDAECIASIEHLQIKNATSVIEAKTFFLSTDWSLIRLQRNDYEYKDKTDFVVLPSQLLQVFCMTSSTTDYYEAFLGLFSSSHTSFGTNTLSNSQIQEIMGRIAMYEGTTPSFAEKILTSQLIQTSFAEKETEVAKNDLIDSVMFSEVALMEKDIEIKDKVLEENEKVINETKNNNVEKDSFINELSIRITSLEGKYNATTEKLGEAEKINSKYKNHLETEALRKCKIIASLRVVIGWILIDAGIILLLTCIAALIPITSNLVEPCFNWIGSSKTIIGDQNNPLDIIGIIAAISIAMIPAGLTCKKNGFAKITQSYYDNYIKKFN